MTQDLNEQILQLREEMHKKKRATMVLPQGVSWKNSLARVAIEFVSAIFAGVIVGLLVDGYFSIKPWGIVGGFLLGCLTGFYNIYKEMTGWGGAPPLTKEVSEGDKSSQTSRLSESKMNNS